MEIKTESFLNIAGVIFIALDKNGNVALINKKGCEVLEYPEDKILGKNWFDNFLPKDIRGETKDIFLKIMAGKIKPYEYYTNPILTKSGEKRLIHFNNTIILGTNGEIAGILSSGLDITEKREFEYKLKESENRYRTLVEGASEGVLVADIKTHEFIYTNPAICSILGYTTEELLNLKVEDIHPPEKVNDVLKMFKLQAESKEITIFNIPCLRKDKKIIYCNISARKITLNGTEYNFGIFTDVTEKAKLEKQAKTSEFKFKNIVEQSIEGIALTDESGKISVWNKSIEKITGIKQKDAVGKTIWDMEYRFLPKEEKSPERYMQIKTMMKSFLKSGYKTSNKKKIIRELILPEGQKKYIEMKVFPIKTEKGIVTCAFVNDITNEKIMQLSIKENEEKYKTLIESSNDSIFLMQNGKIVFVNKTLLKTSGFSKKELIGRSFMDFVAPDEKKKIALYYNKRTNKKHAPRRYESKAVLKSGKTIDVEVQIRTIKLQGKHAEYVIMRDITEKKKAEQKIEQSAAKYKALFNGITDAVFVHPLKQAGFSNFIEVNEVACKRYGYSRKEFLQLSPSDISAPEDVKLKGAKQSRKKLLKDRWMIFEATHITKSGEEFPVEISSRIFEFEGSEVIMSVARDITERKLAEKKIKHLNSALLSIRNVNQLIVKERNKKNLIEQASKYLTETHAYQNAWIVLFDKNGDNVIAAESGVGSAFKKFTAKIKKSGRIPCLDKIPEKNGIYIVKNPSKECRSCPIKHLYVNRSPLIMKIEYDKNLYGIMSVSIPSSLVDDPDEQSLFIEVVNDIAYALHGLEKEEKIKFAQKQLEQSEARFRTLSDLAPVGIFLTDSKGKLTYINNKFCQITTCNKINCLGKDWTSFVEPDQKKQITGKWEKTSTQNIPFQYTIKWKQKNGGSISTLAMICPISADNKSTPGFVGIIVDITERIKAEEEIQKLAKIIETTSQCVVITDINGVVHYVNPSYYELSGFGKDEVIGKPMFNFTSPQGASKLKNEIIPELLKYGQWQGEINVLKKDGSLILVELFCSLLTDNSNNPINFVAAFSDISQRRKMENIIRENEAKYRTLFESASDGIFILENNIITDCNNATLKIFGCTDKSSVIGHTPLDFSPEIQPDGTKSEEKAKKLTSKTIKGFPQRFYWKHKRTDGTLIDTDVSLNVMVIKSKKYLQVIIRDITEKITAQAALSESEKSYQNLFDNVTEAIYVQDKDGTFLDVNQGVVEMYGYSKDYFIGKNPGFLTAPDKNDLAEIGKAIEKAFNGEPQEFEFWAVRKNGEIFPKEVHLSKGRYFNKDVIFAFARDITDRKRSENIIMQALKEKEILLQEIHHRVKNNLNIITSLLNLQAQKIENKDQALAALNESRDRVFSMALVHEQLYRSADLSKIDMKQYTEIIAYELKRLHAPSKEISINIKVKNAFLDINRAVPCGLILNEIITNTFKHGFKNKQKGRIDILFSRITAHKYELCIKDNGCGLPAHFDINKADSMGLRLITILTEQLEGSLDIKSDNGTEFKIVFPVY